MTLTLAGCAPTEQVSSTDAKASATPSSSPESPSGDTSSEIEAEALLIAGEPKGLTWLLGQPPSDWLQLEAEQGSMHWQVDDSACLVTMTSMRGYADDGAPDSQELARHAVEQMSRAAGLEPQMSDVTSRPVATRVRTGEAESSSEIFLSFPEVHFTADGGALEGDSRAYVHGDFGLTAMTVCGENNFPDHTAAMSRFVDEGIAAEISF